MQVVGGRVSFGVLRTQGRGGTGLTSEEGSGVVRPCGVGVQISSPGGHGVVELICLAIRPQ
jgi:hypothetical protein